VFVVESLRKESSEGTFAYANWKKWDIEYRIRPLHSGKNFAGKASNHEGQFCSPITATTYQNYSRSREKIVP